MFRLYLEFGRLVSPDRDNGKMVRWRLFMCVVDSQLMSRTLSYRRMEVYPPFMMLECRCVTDIDSYMHAC